MMCYSAFRCLQLFGVVRERSGWPSKVEQPQVRHVKWRRELSWLRVVVD